MERPKNLILALSLIVMFILFVLLSRCQQAECGQDGNILVDQNDVDTVMIALTRLDVNDYELDANGQSVDVNEQILDVNDQILDVNDRPMNPNGETINIDEPTLELRLKIKNNSDQDVWICDSVGFIEDEFEVFMEDDQTLLIRRRLDVLTLPTFYIWPEGQYVRLRAGEYMVNSLSITLPVHNHWIFWPRGGGAGCNICSTPRCRDRLPH